MNHFQINRKPAGILLVIPVIAILMMVVFTPNVSFAEAPLCSSCGGILNEKKLAWCESNCVNEEAAVTTPTRKKKRGGAVTPTPTPTTPTECTVNELSNCELSKKMISHEHGKYATAEAVRNELTKIKKELSHDHFWLWLTAIVALVLALIALIIALLKRSGRNDKDFDEAVNKKVTEKFNTEKSNIVYEAKTAGATAATKAVDGLPKEAPPIDFAAELTNFAGTDDGAKFLIHLIAPPVSRDIEGKLLNASTVDPEINNRVANLEKLHSVRLDYNDKVRLQREAEAKVEQIKAKLAEPQSKVKTAEGELEVLKGQLANAEKDIRDKGKEVEEAKDAIIMLPRNASEDEDTKVRGALATAKTNLSTAEKKNEELPGKIEAKQAEIVKLKEPITEIEGEIKEAEAKAKETSAAVTSVKSKIAEIESSFGSDDVIASAEPKEEIDDGKEEIDLD